MVPNYQIRISTSTVPNHQYPSQDGRHYIPHSNQDNHHVLSCLSKFYGQRSKLKYPNSQTRANAWTWYCGFIPQIGEIWTDYSPWSTSRNKHRGRTRPTKHTPIILISLENGPETELPTKRDPNQPKEIRLLTLVMDILAPRTLQTHYRV